MLLPSKFNQVSWIIRKESIKTRHAPTHANKLIMPLLLSVSLWLWNLFEMLPYSTLQDMALTLWRKRITGLFGKFSSPSYKLQLKYLPLQQFLGTKLGREGIHKNGPGWHQQLQRCVLCNVWLLRMYSTITWIFWKYFEMIGNILCNLKVHK